MSKHSREMQDSIVLADEILTLKKNRFLDSTETVICDKNAFIPEVQEWMHLAGYRRLADDAKTRNAVYEATEKWMRASHKNGAPVTFVLEKNDQMVSAFYGMNGFDAGAEFRSALPEPDFKQMEKWSANGYQYSGIVLGTFLTKGIADMVAGSSLKSIYVACIMIPLSDTEVQQLVERNRRMIGSLEPYKSFQRVYGNASRRVVNMPVENIVQAIQVLNEEIQYFEKASSSGLVRMAIRFGANDYREYQQLAAQIQSCMNGEENGQAYEPIRVFQLMGTFDSAEKCLAIPGTEYHSKRHQRNLLVCLTSLQSVYHAASVCAPPIHSYSGFYVDNMNIDADSRDIFPITRPTGENGIKVGTVYESSDTVSIPLEMMLSHTSVFGACNTGKTTIVKNMVSETWKNGRIPFLVIEAAKKEYHELLSEIPETKILTSGVDGELLRVNPLQPEDGVMIEKHIAAVVDAITASTGAEHPIPEAFSGLLKQTFQRFGWRFGTIAYTDRHKPFPTFKDVLSDIDGYIKEHAMYGPEVRQNLRAALMLRVELLSCGAPGAVCSEAFGMTAKDLLQYPTVLELTDFDSESIGFLMNILLFKIQTYLERLPREHTVKRLIVLEEAHNVFRKTLSEESSLAKSNQAFDKLFAEIRASGTGMIISDQRPGIMSDAVFANTSVKICLAMDSSEDRRIMGDVMNLSDIQRRELHSFGQGECLVSIRGKRGVIHTRAFNREPKRISNAACVVCRSRSRCRSAEVSAALSKKNASLISYHVSKIMMNPYNAEALVKNVDNMFRELDFNVSAAEKICMLGTILNKAGISINNSRIIVRSYEKYMRGTC